MRDRTYTGNVIDWRPPFRSDYVSAGLESVPPARQEQLVDCLLREYILPEGRMILRSYGGPSRPAPRALPVGELLRRWGYAVAHDAEGVAPNGVVVACFGWVTRPLDGEDHV